jgi:hypothetical protein
MVCGWEPQRAGGALQGSGLGGVRRRNWPRSVLARSATISANQRKMRLRVCISSRHERKLAPAIVTATQHLRSRSSLTGVGARIEIGLALASTDRFHSAGHVKTNSWLSSRRQARETGPDREKVGTQDGPRAPSLEPVPYSWNQIPVLP